MKNITHLFLYISAVLSLFLIASPIIEGSSFAPGPDKTQGTAAQLKKLSKLHGKKTNPAKPANPSVKNDTIYAVTSFPDDVDSVEVVDEVTVALEDTAWVDDYDEVIVVAEDTAWVDVVDSAAVNDEPCATEIWIVPDEDLDDEVIVAADEVIVDSVDATPSRNVAPAPSEERIWTAVEKNPQFPGGDPALYKFLGENLKYPPMAVENGIQGRVVVQMVITPTGYVGEVKIVRGVDPDLDREAMRVVRTLPKFIPGMMNGHPVSVWYTLPIQFKLPEK